MFYPLLVRQQGGLAEATVRRLAAHIPRLNNSAPTIAALLAERTAYIAECLVTPAAPWQQADVEGLWQQTHFRRWGTWHRAARAVMLAQPSSAPVERVNGVRRSTRRRVTRLSGGGSDDQLQLS